MHRARKQCTSLSLLSVVLFFLLFSRSLALRRLQMCMRKTVLHIAWHRYLYMMPLIIITGCSSNILSIFLSFSLSLSLSTFFFLFCLLHYISQFSFVLCCCCCCCCFFLLYNSYSLFHDVIIVCST